MMKRVFRESDAARVASIGLLLAVLFILRRPDAIFNAQFWAEDGLVFFAEDLIFGGWASVFHPYSGYLHLVPRIVAAAADPLPVAYVPLFYDTCATMIAAGCCALFASAAYRFLIASDAIRAALCVLFAVAPYADEIVGTIANAQWYLSLGALLLVIAPAQERVSFRTVAVTFGILLFSLSAPQAIVFVPLVAWLAIKRRTIAGALPCLALLAGAGAQVMVFLPHRAAVAGQGFDAVQLAIATGLAFAHRVAMSTIVGHTYAERLAASAPAVAPIVGAIVLIAPLVLVRHVRRRFAQAATAAAIMLATIALAMSFRGNAVVFADYAHFSVWRGERYFFLAACLMLFLLGSAVDVMRGRARAYAAAAAMTLVLAGTEQNARVGPFRDDDWAHYAPMVTAWRAADAAHLRAVQISVPINPGMNLTLPDEEASDRGTSGRWENRLIQGPDTLPNRRVYLVRNGRRRWIVHDSWMGAHGFGWPSGINRVSSAELDAIPLGDPIVQER